MMNDKSVTVITFAVFGIFVYPLAIAFHQHFYADGAFFFAQLVEHGRVAVAGHNPARYLNHLITQFPTVFALKAGISDPAILSRIYGSNLYYTPFFCYLFSAWLFLRKGMTLQVLLLSLMFILLSSFTSLFIISESHLAAALFILTFSVIVTCDFGRFTTLFALLCLALLGLSSYEFWALYYLLCLVYFIQKIWKKKVPFSHMALEVLIAIVFLGGVAVNGYAIIFSKYAENRDAMLSSHLHSVLPTVIAVSLFFGATILYMYCSRMMLTSAQLRTDRLHIMILLQKWCSSRKFALVTLIFGILTCAIYFINIPKVNYAYNLRILNLILPVMFGLSFMLPQQRMSKFAGQRGVANFILPVVILAVMAHLYQTSQWITFKKSFFNALQVHSGYVPMQYAELLEREFLWSWTSPSMSILLQALESVPIQTILFNPKKRWEPYGPTPVPNCDPETLANCLGVPFFL
jgi:hypothetical protein